MKKRVLIVRLDAIGDYVLWRNTLRFLRNSAKFSNAHIAVLGNPAWRDLAETLDGDCADEWIWVENRDDLFRKPYENILPNAIWRRRVVSAQKRLKDILVARGFDTVISPAAYPDRLLDELVLGIAPTTIAVANGNSAREGKFTQLVGSGEEGFVFFRNKAIASAIADEPCTVDFKMALNGMPEKTNRILFFKSASHWTRRWPLRRWRELEKMLPAGFSSIEPHVGASLADFAGLVRSCAAVVSNDTMALHMAAALDVPAVGIANGVSGRGSFWPYPKSLNRCVEVCIPDKVPSLPVPMLGERLSQYLALASVEVRTVADALRRVMDEQNRKSANL